MFVKEGLYECHCHNVSVLRLSMKCLMIAFMSCYKMSCYHHQRFCLACCGQKGCLIGTCKKKWSSKCIFMLAIKSFCVCVLSLCVQSSQNYGCKLNYQFTAMLASIAWNVGFITETAGVSKPCLVGKTILNEYSIQLAFKPQLSLFLLDLSWLTVLIHFHWIYFTIVFIFMWVPSI